jgi:hypothetical protein
VTASGTACAGLHQNENRAGQSVQPWFACLVATALQERLLLDLWSSEDFLK